MGRAQGPRQREDALSRSLRGCGRAVVAAPAARCGFWRGGGAGPRFPPPGFSPRRPPFPGLRPLGCGHASGRKRPPGGAPFECGSSAGGQTHPRSVACAPSLGATARRPFSFVWAAALRVPPEIPRRSLNTPIPPQSCGGRSRVRRRDASRTAPALPRSPPASLAKLSLKHMASRIQRKGGMPYSDVRSFGFGPSGHLPNGT